MPAGDYEDAKVKVREKFLNVRVVNTPFVYKGKIKIDIEEKIYE
jgi:hypothetical protein